MLLRGNLTLGFRISRQPNHRWGQEHGASEAADFEELEGRERPFLLTNVFGPH